MTSVSDRGHAPSDSAARERAIESNGSVLVQAPAGSGKTTLLVQRYLRLLARVDAPEHILALTFTRRAAQEMRDRVLQAVHDGGLSECPDNLNARTWELAVAARRRLESLGLDIERQPARLRIETIDAFNAWLAAQLPIASGAGGGFHVQTNAAPSYEEAARRSLAHDAADIFGASVERVLELDDQRWRQLRDLIAKMLPSRDRWLPQLAGRLHAASALDEAQLARVRAHLDEDLQLLIARVLDRARELLGGERIAAVTPLMRAAARRMARELPDISVHAVWAADEGSLAAQVADLERWRSFAKICLTQKGDFRRRLTKKEGFPPQCADGPAMLALFEELGREPMARRVLLEIRALPAAAYSDEQWARVREVSQVLVLAAAQLDQVFRERGAVDFPAVSLAALRALGGESDPTDLGLRLDYRLQHILVDEFQDTSGAQLELIRLITSGWQSGDGRSIFCVGDPMQSIYAFRQAEVRAFLELAEDGIGGLRFQVERLRENFRSAKPLVDWINSSFSRVMPRADDRARGAIAFRPSVAAIEDSLPGRRGGAHVQLQGFASRSAEAGAVTGMIAEQLDLHPQWRIVVLVRARSHAREIAASLRERRIAFRAVDIEPLHDRAIVRDILMLLCALLHLGDRTAWLAVLRAPWGGVPLADLLLISRASPLIWEALADEAVLDQLSVEGRSRSLRLRAVLGAALMARNESTLARWVESTWLSLGGPACASTPHELELASAAFARLRVLEEQGLPDPAELSGSFADLYADHGGASAVEIMTIHKAKGLEFDMVVLPGLDRFVPRHRDQLLATHEFASTGREGLVMAARPAIGADTDPLFEFLRLQQRDAAALEAQRLLYVGCTRAKWELRLTATINRPDDSGEDAEEPRAPSTWSPPVGSLLAVVWPVMAQCFAADTIAGLPMRGEQATPRGGPLLRVPRDWAPMEESFSVAAEPLPSAATPREETPVFDWAGETARRVGSLVHAELQAMDLAISHEHSVRAREPHFRRWLALRGVPADRLEESAARVTAALIAVQRDPRGRWILQKARDDLREHALSGHWQGEVVRVVFDRSFVDEAGVRWVIDYKTSQHQGSGLEEFLDREVERYRPQLQRYGELAKRLGPEPVRLGLYFPLMRAWREWAP